MYTTYIPINSIIQIARLTLVLFTIQMSQLTEVDGGSNGSHVGLGILLLQGAESKETPGLHSQPLREGLDSAAGNTQVTTLGAVSHVNS